MSAKAAWASRFLSSLLPGSGSASHLLSSQSLMLELPQGKALIMCWEREPHWRGWGWAKNSTFPVFMHPTGGWGHHASGKGRQYGTPMSQRLVFLIGPVREPPTVPFKLDIWVPLFGLSRFPVESHGIHMGLQTFPPTPTGLRVWPLIKSLVQLCMRHWGNDEQQWVRHSCSHLTPGHLEALLSTRLCSQEGWPWAKAILMRLLILGLHFSVHDRLWCDWILATWTRICGHRLFPGLIYL